MFRAPEFRGDENLLPRDTALSDPFSDFFLVAVYEGLMYRDRSERDGVE